MSARGHARRPAPEQQGEPLDDVIRPYAEPGGTPLEGLVHEVRLGDT
jgi:hypothetical protein